MDQDHLVDRLRLIAFSILFVSLSSCSTNDKNKHQSNEISDSVSYKKPLANKEKKKPATFQKVAIPEINGKTIKCQIADDCISFYKFKNDFEYEHWNCEFQELNQGKYEVIDSLLTFTTKRIEGNIDLYEETVKYSYVYSGVFFVLEKREVLDKERWITTYERSKRTRTHGKEFRYYFE